MLIHPEQKKTEIFVGNAKTGPVAEHLRSLKTVRTGNQAYDIHGKKIPQEYMRPLFVSHEEAAKYDRIMTDRMKAISHA